MAKSEYTVGRDCLNNQCVWTPEGNFLCACQTRKDARMIADLLNRQSKQQLPELQGSDGAISTRGKWESGKVTE